MRNAIIFDVDGTLVDVTSVRHHVIPRPPNRSKNFEKFHAGAIDCPPHEWVVAHARRWHELGHDIIIVTARQAKWRNQTAFWLAMNGVPSQAMFMRKNKDQRPDYEVKTDILKQIRAAGWNPVLAYDDNPHVIKVWQEHGIRTVIVPGYMEES